MPLLLLPVPGQRVRPRPTRCPPALRWFAEHQPFTPFIETLRGLLLGTPIGNNAILTIGWCVAISLGGYLWARSAYERQSVRA